MKIHQKLNGTISIDYLKEVIIADFGRKLTTAERKDLLKQILYEFSIEKEIVFRDSCYFYVELFEFKDKHSDKALSKVLKELVKYKDLRLSKKRQVDRIILMIRDSIKQLHTYARICEEIPLLIENGNKANVKQEVEICHKMLERYLADNNYGGEIKFKEKITYEITYYESKK